MYQEPQQLHAVIGIGDLIVLAVGTELLEIRKFYRTCHRLIQQHGICQVHIAIQIHIAIEHIRRPFLVLFLRPEGFWNGAQQVIQFLSKAMQRSRG